MSHKRIRREAAPVHAFDVVARSLRSSVDAAASAASAIAGAGGALVFELTRAAQGVHVMRVHRRADGSRVHCSVLFDGIEGFTDWLDADPMRFTHPLVFQQARRCFVQLVGAGGDDGSARG